MRLIGTLTSPYTRKVRIVAAELQLGSRMEFQAIDLADPPGELDGNPLRKVPVLFLGNGTPIYDSPVIVEWLDAEFGQHRLLPAEGPLRWEILVIQALADGLADAAVAVRAERQRPEEQRAETSIQKQVGKIERALGRLEAESAWRERPIDLGQIAVGAALGYLGLRLPELLEAQRPALRGWYDAFAARPSMLETAPA